MKHIEFIINHWQLWSALAVILGLLAFEEFKAKIFGIAHLNPSAATLMLNHENPVIIDVRKVEAYHKGHILGAINISIADDTIITETLSKYKDRSIILVDNNESETPSISRKLTKAGFEKVYTLAGGIVAWNNANLPMVNSN